MKPYQRDFLSAAIFLVWVIIEIVLIILYRSIFDYVLAALFVVASIFFFFLGRWRRSKQI